MLRVDAGISNVDDKPTFEPGEHAGRRRALSTVRLACGPLGLIVGFIVLGALAGVIAADDPTAEPGALVERRIEWPTNGAPPHLTDVTTE
ncbi:MAG: hypothetical protein ACI8Y4_005565 [Candidatus Poriferisodalaceae bacterium]|jgi:hypothetical protein